MSHTQVYPQAERAMAQTHIVENQPPALAGHNLFNDDQVLRDWVAHFGVSGREHRIGLSG